MAISPHFNPPHKSFNATALQDDTFPERETATAALKPQEFAVEKE
jgi:hypothetical protein